MYMKCHLYCRVVSFKIVNFYSNYLLWHWILFFILYVAICIYALWDLLKSSIMNRCSKEILRKIWKTSCSTFTVFLWTVFLKDLMVADSTCIRIWSPSPSDQKSIFTTWKFNKWWTRYVSALVIFMCPKLAPAGGCGGVGSKQNKKQKQKQNL